MVLDILRLGLYQILFLDKVPASAAVNEAVEQAKRYANRSAAGLVNGVLLAVLSMPCVLGFNVLAGFTVPGIGDIQAIEDFLVSNNILPWGGLLLVLFCTRKSGWGWEGFLAEADTGSGLKFPRWARGYVTYIIPVGMLIVFAMGYAPIIAKWAGLG